MKHKLSASVGAGGVNHPQDVLTVQNRLRELGFHWVAADGKAGTVTIRTIRLFQAIFRGLDRISTSQVDGRIDVPGLTYRWLNASNAPRWASLPNGSKTDKTIGFFNFTKLGDGDKNYFGVNWLLNSIEMTGKHYADMYLQNNAGASVMYINNISKDAGGSLSPHKTHQTGINADILLPRKSGISGNIKWNSDDYDRKAAEAMLKSVKENIKADIVLFNDPELIAKQLCSPFPGHDNHIHIRIEPEPIGTLLEN